MSLNEDTSRSILAGTEPHIERRIAEAVAAERKALIVLANQLPANKRTFYDLYMAIQVRAGVTRA